MFPKAADLRLQRSASLPSGMSDALSDGQPQANTQGPAVTRYKFMSAAELDDFQAMSAQLKEAVETVKALKGGLSRATPLHELFVSPLNLVAQ